MDSDHDTNWSLKTDHTVIECMSKNGIGVLVIAI